MSWKHSHRGHVLGAERRAEPIDVSADQLARVMAGVRPITVDPVLRLGHWFETNPRMNDWTNCR